MEINNNKQTKRFKQRRKETTRKGTVIYCLYNNNLLFHSYMVSLNYLQINSGQKHK